MAEFYHKKLKRNIVLLDRVTDSPHYFLYTYNAINGLRRIIVDLRDLDLPENKQINLPYKD